MNKSLIEEYSNASNSTIIELDLGKDIIKIGTAAFYECPNLESLKTSSSLKEIENKAFTGCTKLSKVKFEEGLEAIGEEAFMNNTSLEEVVLPYSLKELGVNAFKGCVNLKKVKINSLDLKEGIPEGAFAECINLEEIEFSNKTMKVANTAFRGCIKAAKFIAPIATAVALDIAFTKGVGTVMGTVVSKAGKKTASTMLGGSITSKADKLSKGFNLSKK